MRTSKFACRVLDYPLCLVLIFVVCLLLFGIVSRLNIPNVSYTTVTKFHHYDHNHVVISKGEGYPPVLAYWIIGTRGESNKMLRLLKAIYHPRNQYLLQLDDASSESERMELAISVHSFKVFEAFENVNVIGKSYAINRIGSSALSATLHAAALLLKLKQDWDWFITLTASDYPLMTQDDLLHAFTFLPTHLNFIHYTNKTVQKVQRNIDQIVVDQSLHDERSSPLFFAVEPRDKPDAFKIFGGSPWMILTRDFMDYCVNGWDNLPRKLLMFFTNVAYPLEYYFHTVLCNSLEFLNTTVDNNLMYNLWDTDPSETQLIDLSYYDTMLENGAAFAHPFGENDIVLDKIDDLILNRTSNGLVQGKWCSNTEAEDELCIMSSNIDDVKPGLHGIKLKTMLDEIVKNKVYRTSQCQFQ
ncbi:PREDICTED: beta-glucuronosyltransferase GlcAT14C-like [Lupinus angustifolius]|uniref:beta-glucuronosyltransferase GlcAT14C-like n=1 Tax=Lupinus angustifolius TaxID=3871 RepID=UPI00092FC217|nr:PREDICTED: beta-glucuronosyltransferase GlcAT14C-like [Lupinus angustifolius]